MPKCSTLKLLIIVTLVFFATYVGGKKSIPTQAAQNQMLYLPLITKSNPEQITRNVIVLDYSPLIQGLPVWEYFDPDDKDHHWNDPEILEEGFIESMRQITDDVVDFKIQQRIIIPEFPLKDDGFQYDAQSYVRCINNPSTCHQPDLISMERLITDNPIVCEKIRQGEAHEVWIWGGPYFGYSETQTMAKEIGSTTDQHNEPDMASMTMSGAVCGGPRFHVYGFSYEREVREMLHNTGHRVEESMAGYFGIWNFQYFLNPSTIPGNLTPWDIFTARGFDPIAPGCGNVHGAINLLQFNTADPGGYYYWIGAPVQSRCTNFGVNPSIATPTSSIGCSTWGCTEEGFLKLWLGMIPNYPGQTNGLTNNWWEIVLSNQY
ncbi:hypothetical protein KC573_01745 [candidate division WWE3 bacterium]|uniref:Uncharacterized protein n=1 Tax=candidate division WWE3 bacterium TaxID=2053526 RepID=A0A955RWR7_UNCKA|nr:hypothetical protein [candidate division WWE3 bacterium]